MELLRRTYGLEGSSQSLGQVSALSDSRSPDKSARVARRLDAEAEGCTTLSRSFAALPGSSPQVRCAGRMCVQSCVSKAWHGIDVPHVRERHTACRARGACQAATRCTSRASGCLRLRARRARRALHSCQLAPRARRCAKSSRHCRPCRTTLAPGRRYRCLAAAATTAPSSTTSPTPSLQSPRRVPRGAAAAPQRTSARKRRRKSGGRCRSARALRCRSAPRTLLVKRASAAAARRASARAL